MDKQLWISFLRLVDKGSVEELLQSLETHRIRRGPVRSDVMRVVRLIDDELFARDLLSAPRKGRR